MAELWSRSFNAPPKWKSCPKCNIRGLLGSISKWSSAMSIHPVDLRKSSTSSSLFCGLISSTSPAAYLPDSRCLSGVDRNEQTSMLETHNLSPSPKSCKSSMSSSKFLTSCHHPAAVTRRFSRTVAHLTSSSQAGGGCGLGLNVGASLKGTSTLRSRILAGGMPVRLIRDMSSDESAGANGSIA